MNVTTRVSNIIFYEIQTNYVCVCVSLSLCVCVFSRGRKKWPEKGYLVLPLEKA